MWLQSFVFYWFSCNLFTATVVAEPTSPTADYYIGAVVEFPAHTATPSMATVQDRIRQFAQLIDKSAIRPDIVVFPEEVLNDRAQPIVLPMPSAAIVPCSAHPERYDFIVRETSCYARSLNLYILINVMEVQNCTQSLDIVEISAKCPIYNTNVVFDRGGVLISRYRKYNLIGDEWLYLNYTTQPEEEAIFHTDFNVTFGHFTRMDLLYARPAQELVQRGITDFLHPSKWQSELPFMTTIQLHQSWAYTNNVNLLGAGTNDPRNGRSGSGIYAGKYGMLVGSVTSNEGQSKLHFSVVPKRGVKNSGALETFKLTQKGRRDLGKQTHSSTKALNKNTNMSGVLDRFTGVHLMRDNDIDSFVTQLLEDDASTSNPLQQQLCHRDLCCDFHIERSANAFANAWTTSYYYRLAAFRGLGAFLNTERKAVGVCAIFACTGDHLYSCGRIYDESVEVVPRYSFDFVRISGNFTKENASLLMPNSVDNLLMPLAVDAFQWEVQEYSNFTRANLSLVQPRADLLTFGIYDNYFLDDTAYDHHKDGAGCLHLTFWLVLMAFVITL